MTITGEATPYLGRYSAVKRMAEAIPQARLIVLLRNPVDRAYSDYDQVTRKGLRPRTFEDAIEAEERAIEASKIPPLNKKASELGNRGGLGNTRYRYLSRGIYVD